MGVEGQICDVHPTIFHFLLLSLRFIHKNEQILLSDEVFLIHHGNGKLFKVSNLSVPSLNIMKKILFNTQIYEHIYQK